jgi:hypothetical protein
MNEIPLDVMSQLTRPEGPAYSRAQMLVPLGAGAGNGRRGEQGEAR